MSEASSIASTSMTAGQAPANLALLRRRARTGIWVEAAGCIGLLAIAFALPSFLTDRGLRLEWIFRAVLLASFAVVVVRALQRRLLVPLRVELTDDEMALAVERRAPDVKQALISSLQFDRELRGGGPAVESPALKAAVVSQVRSQLATIPFGRAIETGRIGRFALGIVAAAAFFVGWAALSPASLSIWARRNVLLTDVDWPRYTALDWADTATGGVRLPQGDPLTVRVTVEGPVPDQVFLDYEFRSGERGTEPMSRTGEREFVWTLDAALGDMRLRAQGGDSLAIELAVTVVERPRIDGFELVVTFPDYMERDPETVPPTEGEVRLPRGAKLMIGGRSHKPIEEAFALFGAEQKIPLERGADGFAFRGELAPATSGLLVVDVVDRDRLGAGTPPKLLLRVGDDKPPSLDFRLRGIGSSITAHARIPGDLKVKDDFGLREVKASMRVTVEQAADRPPGDEKPVAVEEPFQSVDATFGAPLPRSAVRWETTAMVDCKQWSPVLDENSLQNRIRPGMLLSLRFGAKDNFGPGDPHEGFGETMTFRVVTREKLVEELRRRQLEQRGELLRIAEELQAAALELDLADPAQAGDRRAVVEARLQALARQQQALGRRVAFVGESYQRILWEYENNRIWDANQVRAMEAKIPEPLASLAKEAFPATSRLVMQFAGNGDKQTKSSAVDGYKDIQRRIAAVLKEMEQAESLAALLEDLRVVIKIEDSTIDDVQKRVTDREAQMFGDGKDKKK